MTMAAEKRTMRTITVHSSCSALLSFLLSFSIQDFSSSFVIFPKRWVHPTPNGSRSARRTRTTVLDASGRLASSLSAEFNTTGQERYGHDELILQQSPLQRRRIRAVENDASFLTIPVLASAPMAKPLLIGSSLEIDPPTLGQWQTLEECVALHQIFINQQQQQQQRNHTPNYGAKPSTSMDNVTAIDAAPLVAVLDEYTTVAYIEAMQNNKQRQHQQQLKTKRRYATIAAVVGISASSKAQSKKQKSLEEYSFMEIVSTTCRSRISPLSSKIRLVGVGRAELIDFFYQMPTQIQVDDNVECIIEDDDEDDDGDDESDQPRFTMDLENPPDPIVMAIFSILHDEPKSSINTLQQIGMKGTRSPHMAPVFAIAEMSKLANQVTRLHEDRRQIVNQILAAKQQLEQQYHMFDDIDGLGSLAIMMDSNPSTAERRISPTTSGLNLFVEAERLLVQCHNFGLNYYSSLSTIPQLTGVAEQLLEDYYSPSYRSTEEYRLEVLSFVAFRSLEGYCSTVDLARALVCTNTIERLNRAYELMQDHFWTLKDILKKANEDLLALDTAQEQSIE